MASITGSREESIFGLTKFLGLNENPDGDTKLKNGEATICQNWKITRDRNLRRRSGYAIPTYLNGITPTPLNLGDAPIMGLWSGELNGKTELVGACNGHLWKLWDDDNGTYIKQDLGTLVTDNRVTFIPFGGIVYILNGHEYYQYDGDYFKMVVGYRPLVATSLTPSGGQPEGGSLLEEVNKLTGARRVWYSPDGTSTDFVLSLESNIISVDYVMNTADGSYISPSAYTINLATKTVTFTTAPTMGTNTIEIGYTGINTYRDDVVKMRFGELYSGSTDINLFLYGNGTNEAIYSGFDYNGSPRGDYFPDLNEVAVGDKNTPITSLVRHLSTLVAFKPTSTYAITYGTVSTATGDNIQGFYCTPINRTLGNEPMGMVQIVLNAPYTICGNDVYEWRSSSYYSSALSKDERTAKRVTDRVYATLQEFDLQNVYTFDDNYTQEYYIVDVANGNALVWNYAADAWYYYTDLPMNCAVKFDGDLVFGSTVGNIEVMNEKYFSDNGVAFPSVWESGSMDFGRPYERKFSSEMWVVIKPESRGHVGVTVRTDRKADFDVKSTDSSLLDFWEIDFRDFSFDVNRSPKTYRHRLKAKKFCYYKLRLESNDDVTSATVLATNFRVRFIGFAK